MADPKTVYHYQLSTMLCATKMHVNCVAIDHIGTVEVRVKVIAISLDGLFVDPAALRLNSVP